MDAPKCRTCGERHWQRICPKYAKPSKPRLQAVVVSTATPVTPSRDAPVHHVTRCLQCEMYVAEIKQLKMALAKKQGDDAERARRYRASKREKSGDL